MKYFKKIGTFDRYKTLTQAKRNSSHIKFYVANIIIKKVVTVKLKKNKYTL